MTVLFKFQKRQDNLKNKVLDKLESKFKNKVMKIVKNVEKKWVIKFMIRNEIKIKTKKIKWYPKKLIYNVIKITTITRKYDDCYHENEKKIRERDRNTK